MQQQSRYGIGVSGKRTLTLPGGAAIVLSTWLMSRWVRMAEQRADAAEQEAKKWHDEAVAAQAKLAAMQTETERRPRHRRRLRRAAI